ncbi:MAG: hypothetical protein JWO63_1068 [Frankiales bacterium]|nr:hypothetical protein [Frankiales bacterium]
MMLRSATAPSLPSGLLARLAGLPMSTPLPPPSSGGLPTALDDDGVPVFVAYRPENKRAAASRQRHAAAHGASSDASRDADRPADGGTDKGTSDDDAHHRTALPPAPSPRVGLGFRRGVLPVSLIASAAAVVAAGTIGGQVSSLAGVGTTGAGAATGAQAALVSHALAQSGSAQPVMRVSSPTAVPPTSALTVVLDEVGPPAP